MTKLPHTPGPWESTPEKTPVRIIGANAEQIAAVYGGFVGEAEQVANARLIAAAPALLEYVSTQADKGDNDARGILDLVKAPSA